jgi:hypothetical protein
MYRRLVSAIDLGLREGEMLKVEIKHIDFTSWAITLPPERRAAPRQTALRPCTQ